MKKKNIILILIMFLILTLTTGCDNDELKGANTKVSVYPYGELLIPDSNTEEGDYTISSIYPNGADIKEYKLTDKQLTDYSKSTTLFVYNGLSNEKEIAKTLHISRSYVSRIEKRALTKILREFRMDNKDKDIKKHYTEQR